MKEKVESSIKKKTICKANAVKGRIDPKFYYAGLFVNRLGMTPAFKSTVKNRRGRKNYLTY
ncbi:MAG: hypothetical protein D8M57_19275 [Candidatus Scalindua sp. AMX11]|nr:MAG: hypothetical protein DWQ00_14775 [Candidatus Scalindua sp.]TDE63253.1 MAG: hypothetical protein D8M57_19275 [Candidatus Scalindua sp. AMX11]